MSHAIAPEGSLQQPQARDNGAALPTDTISQGFDAQIACFGRDLHSLRNKVRVSQAALREARIETMQRLAAAAELKDDDTGIHVLRMGHFSALIAARCGQDAAFCDMLKVASQMHDVGKIGIPDAILKKRGHLTPEEWSVMRLHPGIGGRLLDAVDDDLFRLAARIAHNHHEKFDGSGYPNALSGQAIPLAARIVAVADFFDALTMDRCYRKALSIAAACELIRSGSGTHFDPEVVTAFFKALDEIVRVKDFLNSGAARDATTQTTQQGGISHE